MPIKWTGSITHCSNTDRLPLQQHRSAAATVATSKNSQKNNREKRKNNFIDHSMTPPRTVHIKTHHLFLSSSFFSFRLLKKTGIKNVLQEEKINKDDETYLHCKFVHTARNAGAKDGRRSTAIDRTERVKSQIKHYITRMCACVSDCAI